MSTSHVDAKTTSREPRHQQTRGQFVLFTAIAAIVAAAAAWLSEALALEVWIMFAGFIAWFTRPTSTRDGIHSMICLWLGILLAAISYWATGSLISLAASLALPLVVFAVALLVVGLRTTPVLDNMLGWFLGLVTYFAAELEPQLTSFANLGLATAIGGFAGWACQALNRRFAEA
ncbi:DUF1097 domain-containing protein [Sphingobium sp. Sx8-8]|uniref:DUF1097 domain-containing protein n=1 Tax=Sphingobium sp. Sx8-8 TaxID=2933617 RepID=UPI001F573B2A|nr:DUF1097 domain-containing protein [Sphingobium sp. Sx8-8]